MPVESAHDIADLLPGAELHVIDGWGHDIPVALVPEVVELIVSTAAKAAP